VILQKSIGEWTTRAIHDTVDAIARQPAYAVPLRRSLLGRVVGWLFERFGELVELFRGSRDLRIAAIVAAALILFAIVGRIVVARQIDTVRRRGGFGAELGKGERRDYWNLARELAAKGDHVAASHALYAAVIDSLARSGAITFHSSKTSGDYARELFRRGAANASEFRAFARSFDRVVYGTATVGADDYARLSDMAEKLVVIRSAA
jgi:hypothetical protein